MAEVVGEVKSLAKESGSVSWRAAVEAENLTDALLTQAEEEGIPDFFGSHFLAFGPGRNPDSLKMAFSNSAPHTISTGLCLMDQVSTQLPGAGLCLGYLGG